MIKEGRTSSNKLNYVTELGNIIDGMKSDIEKKGTVNWDEITKDNSKALLIGHEIDKIANHISDKSELRDLYFAVLGGKIQKDRTVGKGKITVEPLNENETINFYNSVKQFANKKHIVLHEEGKINNKIDEMSAKIEQNKIITIKNKIEKSDSVYSTFEKIISSEFDRTDILDNNRFRGGKASNSKEWNGFAKQITDMKEYFDIMRNEKKDDLETSNTHMKNAIILTEDLSLKAQLYVVEKEGQFIAGSSDSGKARLEFAREMISISERMKIANEIIKNDKLNIDLSANGLNISKQQMIDMVTNGEYVKSTYLASYNAFSSNGMKNLTSGRIRDNESLTEYISSAVAAEKLADRAANQALAKQGGKYNTPESKQFFVQNYKKQLFNSTQFIDYLKKKNFNTPEKVAAIDSVEMNADFKKHVIDKVSVKIGEKAVKSADAMNKMKENLQNIRQAGNPKIKNPQIKVTQAKGPMA